MANRLYFLDSHIATAYDFSGDAQANDNITGTGISSPAGLLVLEDLLYFLDSHDDKAQAYDFEGNAQTSDDKNLLTILGETALTLLGGTVTSDRIIITAITNSGRFAKFLTHNWVYQSSEDINFGSDFIANSVIATDSRIYFLDNASDTAVAYDLSRVRQSSDDISLGTGSWSGGARSDNRLYFINNANSGTNANTAVAYDFSRAAQSSDNISLGTGNWFGGATQFEQDATLTISTTETHITTGRTIDIDIASDIDISDFVASDITVTGGTRGTLTETDAQNFMLSVTAGAVGTLNISIAADAVSPGNTAVDEDFTIVAEPAATLYFFDDTEAIAYAVSDANVSTRDTGSDRDFADIISGLDTGDDVVGAVATATRIGILDNTNKRIWVLDRDWNYIAAETIQLRSGIAYTSICAIADRWVVYNQSDARLEFWDTSSRTEQTSERHSIVDAINGLFSDETYIYLVSNVHNRLDRRTHGSTTVSTFISSLGSSDWQSGTITTDRIILTETSGTDTAVFYNRSGTLQSSETITLPSGGYTASMALQQVATLTISTTETHLHTEKTFDIDITSDIDIDDFVVGDVTVTGGTANSLTETDAQNWVLNVTAGSVGTMNVAIAQDTVSPSNVAADEDFTIEARATVTIAFADDDVDGGDSADATVTFSEAPTGLTLSDFSVNAGTVDSISGSGTTRTVTVTAPSSGTGTITLTLAEDSIEQGNAEASDSIDYAPADANLTVSTTDTPLYTGKTVDFDIVSDVDISGLTASDITVTGGTRGTLDETDAQNFVLSVTLGDVGTLNIAIAEDAVSPGNVAVDEDFTIYPFTNLTGTGVRVGTATFSGDNRYFRAAASDGTNLYMFTRRQGRIVNTSNGTLTDSGSLFGSNSTSARSATYHNSQILVYLHNDDIYVWTPGTGLAATALIDNLTYATESGLSGTPFFYGIASLDGVLYGADHTSRRLCTIASDGTVTPVGTNTYSNQITGLTAFNGLLLAADSSSGDDKLGTFNTSTGAFTLIHSTNRTPEEHVDCMAGHGGFLYMGVFGVGVFRAYDVKWDRDISAVSLDEGDSETWDLSAISQDAASFAFSSGYTAPSWLTISGTDLVATSAESVESDTEFTPSLDAIRDSVSDTFEHSITVTATTEGTPSAPQNLTASADSNGTEMDLDWDAPSNDGGASITDYQYRYAEGTSVPDSTTWVAIGSTTTAYTVTGLDKGTQYTFEVRAVNSEGGGTAEDVTQTTATTNPDPPTSLSASVTRTTATLSWTAPTDDGGSSITEYQYRYQEGTTAGGTWTDTNSTDTTFEVTGLTANTQYTFEVRTVTSVGQSTGNPSVTATTETLTVPSPPQNLTATADSNGTEMDLDWDAPSDNGGATITGYQYRYQEGTTAGGTWTNTGGTTTAFTVTGLDKGTQYTFQVRAVNSQGQSTSNPSVTETTATTVPDPPTSLTATADSNGTEMDLSWTAPSDDGGSSITEYQYRYQEGTSAGGTWTDTNSTSTSFTVTGLDKNTQYTFQVRTVTSVGQSTSNPSVTETTDTTVPDAPTNLSVTRTHEEATITWDNPTDTGGVTLTDIELRITTGASPGGSWQSLGVVETHTESSLIESTEYTVEVRAENSEGYSTSNPTSTFTTRSADDFVSIEAIDEVFITIGTENYELEVDITGNPTNVYVEGIYEGFYYDWDGTDTVTIKIPEAVRLTMDQVWTVYADDVSREIVYNVVAAAPVITDPGDLTFWRGVENSKFIEVSNSPDTVNVDGDLVGLSHAPGINADEDNGVFITGSVDADADFDKTDFQLTIDANNERGDDAIDVDFDVVDTPNMYLACLRRTNAEAAFSLLRVYEGTANNTEAGVLAYRGPDYPNSTATGDHILYKGFLREGSNNLAIQTDNVLSDHGTPRLVSFSASKPAENSIYEETWGLDFPSTIGDPQGIAIVDVALFADYYVVDATDRRVYGINITGSGESRAISIGDTGGTLPSNYTKLRGIASDAGDVYLVDLATRRILIYDGAGVTGNNIFTSSPTLRRYFVLPTGCTAPGDIFIHGDDCYVVDFGDVDEDYVADSGEDHTVQIYVMDKDTADTTTATATRVFSLPFEYARCNALFIDG